MNKIDNIEETSLNHGDAYHDSKSVNSLMDVLTPHFHSNNLLNDPLSSLPDPAILNKCTYFEHEGMINSIKSNPDSLSFLSLNC